MSSPPEARPLERIVLEIAGDAVREAVGLSPRVEVGVDGCERLAEPAACFVSLHCGSGLRGCVGTLEAEQPLAAAIRRNARAAALHDPRFPPVTAPELCELSVEVSVLTPPQALCVSGVEELLAQLRPGIDGLLLSGGGRRATFLPVVWEQLPEPAAFLAELWRKGGWAPGEWPADMRAARYAAERYGPGGLSG